MDRYELHAQLEPWLWSPGCPVAISRGSLWVDSNTGQKVAQLQLAVLSRRTVTGCTVELSCLDRRGRELEGRTWRYQGLQAADGSFFGQETAIPLPDHRTHRIGVRVTEVRFQEGGWAGPESLWEPLPASGDIGSLFSDPAMAEEYRLAIGEPCVLAPRMYHDLFLCACGCVNLGEDAPCRRCGRTFPQLASAMAPEYLEGRLAERRAREKEEADRVLRAEEKARRRKDSRKYLLTALIAAVVLGLLAWATPTVILPRLRLEQAYSQAQALMEQGSYQEASAAFAALADHKDSEALARECLYLRAVALREEGQYALSLEQFQALGDYADSREQAEQTHQQWLEAEYLAARALVEAKAYPAAAAAFEALGDYRDAADWVVECHMLQREGDYALALTAMESGRYTEAEGMFLALEDYLDSAELALRCHQLQQELDYAQALAAQKEGDLEAAEAGFEALGDYEDSAERLIAVRYTLGCQLVQQEDWSAAVEKLSLCGSYQSTDWFLKQAKMGYCKENPNRDDPKTLEYLKELKAAYFQGAAALYEEVFGWKAQIVAFCDSDQPHAQETVSKFGTIYAHFVITGGEPGQSTDIRTVMTVPGGFQGTVYHPGCADGYAGYTSFAFDTPATAPTGTLGFYVYDSNGKLLCSGFIQVTG